MRVAAIYDIHGNLPALEAVLAEIRRVDVDHIVVGGDVILGPMSREALACLLDLDTPTSFIKGNCEVAVLAAMAGENPAVPAQVLETLRWTAAELGPNHRKILASWPGTTQLNVPDLGEVLFCHGTPRDENEIFTSLTTEDLIAPAFTGLGAITVVCGHTHMQFDRMIGTTRVVNAGSVGMAFGRTGADWLLLGPDIQLRHTPYDLKAAARRIEATNYPQAKEFAQQYVLNSPSEKDMLAAYSRER
jgi:predicted phosphodiesterase